MKHTLAVLALAASALAQPMQRHSALHRRVHARDVEKAAPAQKRNIAATTSTTTGGSDSQLSWLASSNAGPVYLGNDGSKPYSNTIKNDGLEDIKVLFWSKENAFNTTKGPYTWFPDGTTQAAPILMFDLAVGDSQDVSYDEGFSGAYTAIHSTTTLGSGNEISEAWVELTTAGDDTTVDVTREPLAAGGYVTSVQAQGCTSDFDQCFFGCTSLDAGPNACEYDYQLMNCLSSQNPNANNGDPKNGGCYVKGGSFTTSFGKGVGQ